MLPVEIMLDDKVVAQLAFQVLNDVKNSKHTLSQNVLLELYSFFGAELTCATELLEKCRIFIFQTNDGCRKMYKIGNTTEQNTVYPDMNFCMCPVFKEEVLTGKCLTCRHVLAIKLNEISAVCKVKVTKVTDSRFVEFLNDQMNYLEL